MSKNPLTLLRISNVSIIKADDVNDIQITTNYGTFRYSIYEDKWHLMDEIRNQEIKIIGQYKFIYIDTDKNIIVEYQGNQIGIIKIPYNFSSCGLGTGYFVSKKINDKSNDHDELYFWRL